jgi:cyclopropane fatty-acyl-phospholipid synthase-like methyltransferase
MLDSMLREPEGFWDKFYQDREKRIPFFVNKPDENLVQYVEHGTINTGKALELGCGPGRNAIFLAEHGWQVDAVDLSKESLQWAEKRAAEAGVHVNFIKENIFNLEVKESAYDLVYDSGCFHHIAPHRRMSYIELVTKSLKPGGCFALTCFEENGVLGGSDITDWDVYRQKSLHGGLGFTEDKLLHIFQDFEAIGIRKMNAVDPEDQQFGVKGLWTAIFKRT